MNSFRFSATLCVLCGYCLSSPAASAANVLQAEISTTTPAVRSGAAIALVWKLHSESTNLLEGQLQLVVRDADEVVARLTTDTLALPLGDTWQRTLLPPLTVTNDAFGELKISAKFAGRTGTIPLGEHLLNAVPRPLARSLVIGLIQEPQIPLRPEWDALVDSLRFETYRASNDDRTVTTRISRFAPDEVSADPLAWCGFDVVVLVEEALAGLKEPHCRALDRWVQAGGSVCLAPGRSVLQDHHLRFLQELAGDATGETPLAVDSRGRLIPPGDSSADDPGAGAARVVLKRRGLGRVAVVDHDLQDLAAPGRIDDRRRLAAWLWKFRRNQVQPFIDTGRWSLAPPPTEPENPAGIPAIDDLMVLNSEQPATGADPLDAQRLQQIQQLQQQQLQQQMYQSPDQRAFMARELAGLRPRDMPLARTPIRTGDHLLDRLMPGDLKLVPFSLVGLMLFLYVLAIGPADYFLLGALRLRKWTWALFPTVTVGFALAMVWLSHWYMRVSNVPRSVTIVDLGAANQIARSNRFEALFLETAGAVSTNVSRGAFTAMNIQRFSEGTYDSYRRAQLQGVDTQFHLVGAARYEGRVPAQYSVTQDLPQWTPQLNRFFSLSPAEDGPAFDWQQFADSKVYSPAAVVFGDARAPVVTRLLETFGNQSSIYVVTKEEQHCLAGDALVLGRTSQGPSYAPLKQTSTFLKDICTYPGGGLFAVVSQISPTGGDDFEDLALVDPSDVEQWLLIVAVSRDDELVVYRKLYSGDN